MVLDGKWDCMALHKVVSYWAGFLSSLRDFFSSLLALPEYSYVRECSTISRLCSTILNLRYTNTNNLMLHSQSSTLCCRLVFHLSPCVMQDVRPSSGLPHRTVHRFGFRSFVLRNPCLAFHVPRSLLALPLVSLTPLLPASIKSKLCMPRKARLRCAPISAYHTISYTFELRVEKQHVIMYLLCAIGCTLKSIFL